MSEKKEIKNQKWKKLIVILLSIFIVLIITNLINPFWFRFPKRLHDKQEMFQFVIDNQEELEEIANGMMELYDEKREGIIIIDGSDYLKYSFFEFARIIRQYPVSAIIADKKEENYIIQLDFWNPPLRSNYWGIYRTENGEPDFWGGESVGFVEENGVFIQRGSYYKYETEKIIGNWYYYQCMTR